ncbi:TPA: restriction endonuclease subunit S [Enterococcus faecalis]|nr:restriction endonuclease subunit S [Enterococcus faecalis]
MKKVPRLRFRGFQEDWELCKFERIFEKVKSYSLSREVETNEFTGMKYIHYGDIHTKKADKVSENSNIPNIIKKNFALLEIGDLILTDASEDYKGIATPAVIRENTSFDIVAGLHTIALRPKNIDPMFLYYLIKAPTFRKYGYKVGTGMKVFGISSSKVLDFTTYIPKNDETKLVSSFLEKIDYALDLHQRKLDQLKELKKAYLQLMFPKKDETVPQVRFANFEENWELGKLENIIEKQIKGKAKVENLCNGSVEYLDANRLNGGKPIYTKALPDVSERDIIILWDGSKAGKVYYGFKGVLGSTLKAYQLKECANSQFIYQQLLDNQNNIYNNYRTPNIPHVVKNFSSIFPIWMTSFEEQSQMADILSNLDNRIILQQNLTDTMISLKKSYLQNMFI